MIVSIACSKDGVGGNWKNKKHWHWFVLKHSIFNSLLSPFCRCSHYSAHDDTNLQAKGMKMMYLYALIADGCAYLDGAEKDKCTKKRQQLAPQCGDFFCLNFAGGGFCFMEMINALRVTGEWMENHLTELSKQRTSTIAMTTDVADSTCRRNYIRIKNLKTPSAWWRFFIETRNVRFGYEGFKWYRLAMRHQ